MKSLRALLKGSILTLAIVVTLAPVFASAEDVEGIVGPVCFQQDNFVNSWRWMLDNMGNGHIQVTGYDPYWPDSAMDGGGEVKDGHLYLTVVETTPYDGWRAIHAIDYNIATQTGTTDFAWLDPDHNLMVTWVDEPFHKVPCGSALNMGQPNTKGVAVAARPGEVAAKSAGADLMQNVPNPFNPDTWIAYQLEDAADVIINIYDVSGKLVRRLELGHRPAGSYITKDRAAYWDGKNSLGQSVGSGVYFYTLQAGQFTATRKMIIVK